MIGYRFWKDWHDFWNRATDWALTCLDGAETGFNFPCEVLLAGRLVALELSVFFFALAATLSINFLWWVGLSYHLFCSYFNSINCFNLFWSPFESGFAPDCSSYFARYTARHHYNNKMQLSSWISQNEVDIFTSFPRFSMNVISAGVKFVIDMDFTLWGGFRPLLEKQVE